MVAARTKESWRALRTQISSGKMKKRYLAVAEGLTPLHFKNDSKLATDNRKTVSEDSSGSGGETVIRRIGTVETGSRPPNITLVEAESFITTRHQIRAHLAALGFPLLGDLKYGAIGTIADSPLALFEPKSDERFLLHAAGLNFTHPRTGKELQFESKPEWIAPFIADQKSAECLRRTK